MTSYPPVDDQVPESFQRSRPNRKRPDPADHGASRETVTHLADALAYAFIHSRTYQTAKEELYLAALDLTLENICGRQAVR